MEFDLGQNTDYDSLERTFDLFIPGKEKPIKLTLGYAGIENKAYNAKRRVLEVKYQREAQKNPDRMAEIGRTICEEIFPGRIIRKAENVPAIGGDTVTLETPDEIADFVKQLRKGYASGFDEVIQEASNISAFMVSSTTDNQPTGEQIGEAADAMGKS